MIPTRDEAAFNLAITRLLYFSIIFFIVGTESYFLDWQNVPSEFWLPIGPMLGFQTPPLSIEFHSVLFAFWRWTLPLCAIGFAYRLIAPLNFVAGFILMNYAQSFGYQTHTYMPVVLVGLCLSISSASDVLSLDAWFFPKLIRPQLDSRRYQAPLRNAQLVFCFVFFAAGVAKLRQSGLDWITTDSLRNYFLVASLTYVDVHPLAHVIRLNHVLYQMPWLCHILAFLALTVELLAPFAFWSRKAARLIVPALFIAQIAIYFTIFVNFNIYLTLYLSWINWAWVIRKIETVTSRRKFKNISS